mgnify:CR=1 FL=1
MLLSSSPLVNHAIGENLLAAPEPDHIADLVNHALVVLVFGTHHHRTKNAGQNRYNGQRHIPGNQPQQGGNRTPEQEPMVLCKSSRFPNPLKSSFSAFTPVGM